MEKHAMETKDGFKITIHRIPYSSNRISEDEYPTKTVLLVHGILCSSAMWVTNMNNNATSLAFMLSDAGYDVWMLNARGTGVSKEHTKLNMNDGKFWDFSWHEIGMQDVPTAIDYILNKTERQTLHYICHSQGCTALLVTLSMMPEYNEKIASAYLLAPAVYMTHIRGYFPNALRTRKNNGLSKTLDSLGWHAIVAHNNSFSNIVRVLCKDQFLSKICSTIMVNMIGKTIKSVDQNQLLAFLFQFVGDNSALKQFTHYVQLMRSSKFQMYDYGVAKNKKIYKANTPTDYNLTKVKVPISILRATNDPLSTKKDIQTLASRLTSTKSVITVPGNHVDYIFDPNSIIALKDHMLNAMENTV